MWILSTDYIAKLMLKQLKLNYIDFVYSFTIIQSLPEYCAINLFILKLTFMVNVLPNDIG